MPGTVQVLGTHPRTRQTGNCSERAYYSAKDTDKKVNQQVNKIKERQRVIRVIEDTIRALRQRIMEGGCTLDKTEKVLLKR